MKHRRITVTMLRDHLIAMRDQYVQIVANNAGGFSWAEQHKGGLEVINALIQDIDNDIPVMLNHTKTEAYVSKRRVR